MRSRYRASQDALDRIGDGGIGGAREAEFGSRGNHGAVQERHLGSWATALDVDLEGWFFSRASPRDALFHQGLCQARG